MAAILPGIRCRVHELCKDKNMERVVNTVLAESIGTEHAPIT